jgi:multisubunit Na+/H+ antiporter MnhB subunit
MNVYHYIFYRIYRLAESNSMPWWSDFKAGFIIAVVQIWIIVLVDYKVNKHFGFFNTLELGKWGYALVIGGLPLTFNYFFFQYNDRWKPIVKHFNKASKQEKRKMNIQMAVVLVLVGGLVAFLFSL